MKFATLSVAAFAGLAAATPVATSPVDKRGVLAELCIAACLVSSCGIAPPICAACLVTCIGTGDAGEEVDIGAALQHIADGEVTV